MEEINSVGGSLPHEYIPVLADEPDVPDVYEQFDSIEDLQDKIRKMQEQNLTNLNLSNINADHITDDNVDKVLELWNRYLGLAKDLDTSEPVGLFRRIDELNSELKLRQRFHANRPDQRSRSMDNYMQFLQNLLVPISYQVQEKEKKAAS